VRRDAFSAIDRSGDFDLTDEHDHFDDPTELPPPWTPPPDPDFLTGVLPRIERADLEAGRRPGIEPSDSPNETIRFSRAEMLALRDHSGAKRRVQAPAAAPASPAAPVVLPPLVAMKVPSPPVRVVVAHRWQIHHVAIAFALGVLTGILGVIAALALA
jgi:hypothetical protein